MSPSRSIIHRRAPSGMDAAQQSDVHISAAFDGGNIEFGGTNKQGAFDLSIRPDPFCPSDNATHFQWFNFRASNLARGTPSTFNITNAGQASFPGGFKDYDVVASYDASIWFRLPASFDGKVLSWTVEPKHPSMHFAYFAPYPSQRHAELVAELQQVDGVQLSVLGQTLDGRDLDLLQIGTPGEGKRVAWIIARQHPGETMAEWAAEGLLRRLTDRHDPISRALLQSTVFYVVPNMNPDGSARGHLRTNAAGANLNREWAEPSMEHSPEVFCVRNAMDRTGVDVMIDIHGDEALPYNFFVSSSAIPGWTPRLADLEAALSAALVVANPDFQTRVGYPRGAPGKGNLSLGSKQVAQRFDCLAVTLEQPFKDTKETPDKEFGWSPQRAQRLGASLLDAILAVVPKLR
ncbi:hypothetical protein ACKKBG_A23850 [Auxenochlorella protothecoides x Auxenochlorella symbiontica]